jgi:VRR-NUC domain
VKESDFQARIIAIAERFGWQVWHVPAPMVWDARTKAFRPAKGGAGLPDLIMLHDDPPRLVFMEVKAKGGKLSDRQRDFLQAAKLVADSARLDLGALGHEHVVGVFAVWPEDEERVERMLRTFAVA